MKEEPPAFFVSLSLSAGLLFLSSDFCSILLTALGGLECFSVCMCVPLCPERFHGCASFQRTCSVSSTAESGLDERDEKRGKERQREIQAR